MRLKTFQNEDVGQLENEVNNWIVDNKIDESQILTINQTTKEDYVLCYSILYKKKNKVSDKNNI